MLRRQGRSLIRTTGGALLRNGALRRAVLKWAATRASGLALVYHRVRPEGPKDYEVVPTLPSAIVREQLETLAELGDVVPLAALCEPPATRRRVRFGISFDDDEPSHVEHVLPLLRSIGLQGTFFLSGRALHGLGPSWWRCLETLIRDRGLNETCRALGIEARSPAQLAARCQGTSLVEHICELAPSCDARDLDVNQIRSIAASGMSIGFHTLFHPVLTTLSSAECHVALERGRMELSAAAGVPVCLLAYPHGRTNRAVADAAAVAGYHAAFASGGHPISPESHRFCLGRWEPRGVRGDQFVASIALRLMRRADVRPI